jgi:hypothetical protein
MFATHSNLRCDLFGRPGGPRTPNLRFWRPLLCQLSYWPIQIRDQSTARVDLSFAMLAVHGYVCASQCQLSPLAMIAPAFFTSLQKNYLTIFDTTPAPTVRPPSRIAKRKPSSIAIGAISCTVILTLSPGMTISVPAGNCNAPVTSVVRK